MSEAEIQAEMQRILVTRKLRRKTLVNPELLTLAPHEPVLSDYQLLRIFAAWGDAAFLAVEQLGLDALIQAGFATGDVAGEGALRALGKMPPAERDMVSRAVLDCQTYSAWSEFKNFYIVPSDADFRNDIDDHPLPGALLRPVHTNALYAFSMGVPVVVNTGEQGMVRGFFTRGGMKVGEPDPSIAGSTGNITVRSDDPKCDEIQICMVTELDVGRPTSGWDLSMCSVPLTGTFDVSARAAESATNWSVDQSVVGMDTDEKRVEWCQQMLRIAIPTMLYARNPVLRERKDVGKANNRIDTDIRAANVYDLKPPRALTMAGFVADLLAR